MVRVILAFLFFPLFLCAQSTAEKSIDSLTVTLNVLGKKMHRGENDSVRNASAELFQSIIETILKDSSAFTAGFDSIKNISAKTAPDNTFRLYTWTYPKYDGSKYYYYGYLQTNFKDWKRFKGYDPSKHASLFKLSDSTDVIEKPKSTKLNPERWYGAVYYSILKNVKDKKNYYTLLGWHGKNSNVTQKLVDVLSFDGGKPVFGSAFFKTGKVYSHRLIFEFDAQAVMTLRYDEDRKLLVLDHIANTGGRMGPDGTYDAYKYNKSGRWELVEDVDVNAGFKPKTPPKPVPDEQMEEKDRELRKK